MKFANRLKFWKSPAKDEPFKHNFFHTIEAIQEHCNMLWGWYVRQGNSAPIENGRRIITGTVGDFDHEFHVIERYAQELLNELADIHPELYRNS